MPREATGRNGENIDKRVVALVEEDLATRYAKMLRETGDTISAHIRNIMWAEIEAYELKSKPRHA